MSLFEWIRNRRRRRLSYYNKRLARYRQERPESLEKEQQQIRLWVAYAASQRRAPREMAREQQRAEDTRLASALHELREAARTAFMSHPAASELDFRRCWLRIREEILKEHALEELAENPAPLSRLLETNFEPERNNHRLIIAERKIR